MDFRKLREQQQRQGRRHDDHRGEDDRATRRHHRPADRRLRVVALGYLFPEPADDEQPVVDRDTQTDQRHDRLGEEVHGRDQGDQPHDAERAEDGQTADDGGQAGGDHAAEDKEQQHRDQRDGGHLGALLVLADGAGQFGGQRLQTGELDVDVLDEEVLVDLLVVVQDRVVVIALELDRHERVLLARVGHIGQQLRALEVADRPQDLVGVVPLDLGQVVQDLLLEVRVVDGLTVRRGVDGDDVARRVAAVRTVGEQRRLHRRAALVVEPTLGDVLAELAP